MVVLIAQWLNLIAKVCYVRSGHLISDCLEANCLSSYPVSATIVKSSSHEGFGSKENLLRISARQNLERKSQVDGS